MRVGHHGAEPKPDIEPMADGDRSRAFRAMSQLGTIEWE